MRSSQRRFGDRLDSVMIDTKEASGDSGGHDKYQAPCSSVAFQRKIDTDIAARCFFSCWTCTPRRKRQYQFSR